jgi:hypothetical protein
VCEGSQTHQYQTLYAGNGVGHCDENEDNNVIVVGGGGGGEEQNKCECLI